MNNKLTRLLPAALFVCLAPIIALSSNNDTDNTALVSKADSQQYSSIDLVNENRYFGLGIHLFDENARKEISSNTNQFIDKICNAYTSGYIGFYIVHVTFDELLEDVRFDADQPVLRINHKVARDIRSLANRCPIPIGLRFFSPVRGEGKLAKFQADAIRDLFPHTEKGRNLWLHASNNLLSEIADLSQIKFVFWSWEDFWRTTTDWDFALSPNICLWAHRENIFSTNIPKNCQRPFSLSQLEKKRFWTAFDKEIVLAVNQLAQLKRQYPDILFGWQPRIDWDDSITHDHQFDIKGLDFTVLSASAYMADRGNNFVDDQVQRCSRGEQEHCQIIDEQQAVNNILIRLSSYKQKIKTPYVLFDQLLSVHWDKAKGVPYIAPAKRNSFYEALIKNLLSVFQNNNTSVLGVATWGSLERIHNFLLEATFSDSVSGSFSTLRHWEMRLLTAKDAGVLVNNNGLTLDRACIRQQVTLPALKLIRSFARANYSGDRPELEVTCKFPLHTRYLKKSLPNGSLVAVYDDFETTGCTVFMAELCSMGETNLKQIAWGPMDSDGFLTNNWMEHWKSIPAKIDQSIQGHELYQGISNGLTTDVTPSGTTNYWLEQTSKFSYCSISPQNNWEIRFSLFYPETLKKNIGPQSLTVFQTNGAMVSKSIEVGGNNISFRIKNDSPCVTLDLVFDRSCSPETCNGDARPIASLLQQIDVSSF